MKDAILVIGVAVLAYALYQRSQGTGTDSTSPAVAYSGGVNGTSSPALGSALQGGSSSLIGTNTTPTLGSFTQTTTPALPGVTPSAVDPAGASASVASSRGPVMGYGPSFHPLEFSALQ